MKVKREPRKKKWYGYREEKTGSEVMRELAGKSRPEKSCYIRANGKGGKQKHK
jgi:hypothetical protein